MRETTLSFPLLRPPYSSNNIQSSNTKFKSLRSKANIHKTSPTQKPRHRPQPCRGLCPPFGDPFDAARRLRQGGCKAVHPTSCPPTRRKNVGQRKNVHNIRVSSAFDFSISRMNDNDPNVFYHMSFRYVAKKRYQAVGFPCNRMLKLSSSRGIRIDVPVLSISWSSVDHSVIIQALRKGLLEQEASDTGRVPRWKSSCPDRLAEATSRMTINFSESITYIQLCSAW